MFIIDYKIQMGALHEASQPKLEKQQAMIVLVINALFWPGLGTILAGVWAGGENKCVCVGILQMLLAPILVGWIWAIITGCAIYKKSQ